MTEEKYIAPTFNGSAFNCPHCGAFSNQNWYDLRGYNTGLGNIVIQNFNFAHCVHCKRVSIWHGKTMIFPDTSIAPAPNIDLPENIKVDYEEARGIISRSPRGAAALFRLCIQKLCMHLGKSGENLNADIAELVKDGLNPNIQKALDVVRVIGNESVHPGTIDLNDEPETALKLSKILNIITESMITQPKLIDDLYKKLPPEKLDGIESRDK